MVLEITILCAVFLSICALCRIFEIIKDAGFLLVLLALVAGVALGASCVAETEQAFWNLLRSL